MNIREVAKKANVSTATVSRVLNGNLKVNKELQEAVKRVIAQENYSPNAVARSMSRGKTSIIGLCIPDITNPFFPAIARGVEDAASASGYKIILCNTDNHSEIQESYLQMLREQQVEGIILVSAGDGPESFINSMMPEMPVVWCDRIPALESCSSVVTNHHKGIELAVQHLTELGHREIAMIGGPAIRSSAERANFFLELLQDKGLNADNGRVVPGDYGYQSGYNGMLEIMKLGKVTAVFCANDMMAFGAIEAALEAGLDVPTDLSVVGYDNIPFAKWSRPSLTTVAQPTYHLGMTALDMLVNMIEKKQSSTVHRLLEPSLIIRKSTARVSP